MNVLPACFLVDSVMGTTGSFLAFAVVAVRRGVTSDRKGRKSFVDSVGLREATGTLMFSMLIWLFSHRFALRAWIFGGVCRSTIALGILCGVGRFRDRMAAVTLAECPLSSAPAHVR